MSLLTTFSGCWRDLPVNKNPQNENTPLLYNVHQTTARLSMSKVSIRKLVKQERLHKIEHFSTIIIPEWSLQDFAAKPPTNGAKE